MKIIVRPYSALRSSSRFSTCGLHAHVERGHRLVTDDQRRLEHERAGDRDALALAAGELVGLALGGTGRVDADVFQCLADLLRRSDLEPRFQMLSGSATMLATLRRGFSDEIGSWKIICMRVRAARIASVLNVVSSRLRT